GSGRKRPTAGVPLPGRGVLRPARPGPHGMRAQMSNRTSEAQEPFSRLGYKRLNPVWAKLEILLGLGGAGAGLLLGQWALSRPAHEIEWLLAAGGWALFVLGGYLALAGHRSHLYQSLNQQTAFLAEEIRRSTSQGKSS